MLPIDEPVDSVATLQAEFARCILNRNEGLPNAISRCDGGGAPVRRLDVHRNNVFASLIGVVKARFPVVLRLLGEQFFAGTARSFVEHHPPRAPVLSEYGGEFPDFLETFEPAADLPYLADLARLEWAMHVAYHASDRKPLSPAELNRIPAESIAGARLVLHPSVAVIASPYPIVSIWETNSFDEKVRKIGPDLGAEQALVARPELDVRLSRVSPATLILTEALASGADIGRACDVVSESAQGEDISQSLAAILGAGAVVDAEFDAPGQGRLLLTQFAKA